MVAKLKVDQLETVDGTGIITVNNQLTAPSFAGDGSSLTGIDALPAQSGNAGKYLTTNATTASWASAGGGGKIGQVIDSGAGPDLVTIGSASFVALTDGTTALAASITPSATSSSVLMMISIMTYCAGGRGYGVSLRRGGVEFYASTVAYEIFNNNAASNYSKSFWMTLDTGISTTSATEYTVYVKTDGGNDVVFQRNDNESKIILMEILA